ncbi:MAG: hypothetical protein ACYDB3_12230 [Acidimicrobiales bacterium]
MLLITQLNNLLLPPPLTGDTLTAGGTAARPYPLPPPQTERHSAVFLVVVDAEASGAATHNPEPEERRAQGARPLRFHVASSARGVIREDFQVRELLELERLGVDVQGLLGPLKPRE